MQLINPTYLWAMLALAVPVAIHLLSRKEGQVMPMGSLRHLHETTSQQFRGLKLNEVLLLALRLILLLLLILWLAGLSWIKSEKEKWVVVDRSLMNQPLALELADSLVSRGYEWHWLADNFPRRELIPAPVTNYWSLMTDLKSKHLEHGIVLSANRAVDFQGEVVPLPDHIDWQTIEMPDTSGIAYQIPYPDRTVVRRVNTSSVQTELVTDTLESAIDGPGIDSVRVAIITDKNHNEDTRLIRATIAALQKLPALVTTSDQKNADWIIWLSNEKIPDVPTKILFSEYTSSDPLLERVSFSRWRLNKLSTEAILRQNFTVQLADLLTSNPAISQAIDAYDRRRLLPPPSDEIRNAATYLPTEPPVNAGLLILLVIVWMAERIIAFLRKQ